VKRIWKAVLFGAVSLVVGAIALFAVLTYGIFRNACDRFDTVLAIDSGGRSVVYKFAACTTIGTTVEASVDLVSRAGHRETVFSFSPADGLISYRGIQVTGPLEPSATWTSRRSLNISIGTVAAIIKQRSDIADVHVTYDISKNLHIEKDISE
jgi:hypothetical protein